MPLSYLTDAIPTAIGWAHPITGEQLTSKNDLADPVDFYEPNNKRAAFLDPEDADMVLVQTSVNEGTITFGIFSNTTNRIDSVDVEMNGGDAQTFAGRIFDVTEDVEEGLNSADITINYNADPTAVFVDAIAVGAGGSGYTSPPTVVLTGGGGGNATATAVLTGDAVTSVTVDEGGSNFTSAPTVSFTGGGGTGATATATIDSSPAADADEITVSSILVAPTASAPVLISTPVVVSAEDFDNGEIAAIEVTDGGTGYTSAPVVVISGGSGSGGAATATITGDAVTSIEVTDPGSGYTTGSPSTVSLTGGGGSGATAEIDLDTVYSMSPAPIFSSKKTQTLTYQWKEDDVNINGETSATYAIPAEAAGMITCQVTSTNANGSTSASVEMEDV